MLDLPYKSVNICEGDQIGATKSSETEREILQVKDRDRADYENAMEARETRDAATKQVPPDLLVQQEIRRSS